MSVVGYVLRARLRQRWRGLVLVALVVALATGVVLAGASGARRTETAYARFLDAANAGQVLVSTEDGGGYEVLDDVDGIAAVGHLAGLELYPYERFADTDVITFASVDGQIGYTIDRPNVQAGRMPHPDRDDEILVTPPFVEAFGLDVGDRVPLAAQGWLDYSARRPPEPSSPLLDVQITGVGVFTSDVVPTTDLDAMPLIFLPPAGLQAIVDAGGDMAFDGAIVVVEPGADVEQVTAAAMDALGRDSSFSMDSRVIQETVERAIRPQATALWAFTAVVLLAGAFVVGQAIARQAVTAAGDDPALTALGVGRGQLTRIAAIEAAMVGIAGALLGGAGAVLASGAFPVGRARLAEPSSGLEVHVAYLAVAAVAVVLLATGVAAVAARRSAGATARTRTRPSALATGAAAAGAGPRMVLGLRRAFETTGDGATVPVRSGLAGAVLAVAAVGAAATFATNLDALVTDPTRYGQAWSTVVDAQFGPAPAGALVERYADDDRVEGIGAIVYGELEVEGRSVPTIGFDRLAGEVDLTVLDGRQPTTPGEIALGSLTMDLVGATVGDTVTVDGPDGPSPAEVVGRVVFPQLSMGSFNALGLGTGAVVPAAAMPYPYGTDDIVGAIEEGYLPDTWPVEAYVADGAIYNAVLLHATPGAEDELHAAVTSDPVSRLGYMRDLQRPAAISTYADVRGTPVVLAVVLATLAAALVAHVLVTGVHRRRRELATCRAIGMRAGDIATVVRWQASALALVAALIGVPLGVATGRVAWGLLAEDLGVAAATLIPWGWLVLVTLGTLVVANLAGAVPASRARHVRPALALRTE